MATQLKKKKKKWPWIIGGILVILIIGFLFINNQMSKIPGQLSQNLSTTTLKLTTIEDSISASGTIASSDSADVTSSLNSKISTLNVKVGDSVNAGDVLAIFDSTDLKKSVAEAQKSYDSALKQFNLKVSQAKQSLQSAKDNVSSAKTDLEKAKVAYASALGDAVGSDNYNSRYNEAIDKDQATKTANQALTTAESNLTQAQNNYDNTVANDTTTNSKDQLQTAKDNLAKATLTAPISGIISVVNVSIGNTPSGSGTTSSATTSGSTTSSGATAGSGGSTLFTIQSENAFKVNASVADYDVIQLSVGKEVETILDSTSDSYKGKILSVSPIANSSGNYDISASIENPSETDLRVGMSAKVNIVLNKKDNTFVVPVDSIVEENGIKHVVSLDSSDPRNVKKTNIEVTTGMETDYYVEIFGNDLKVGQNIMNDPLNKSKTSQSAGSGGGPSILGGGPAASGGQ